jgi:uncharacterized protein
VLGGLLSGLLGVGGGFVMVPLLVLWTRLPQHRANGTSLLAIVPIALVGVFVYYFQGSRPQVDAGFALLLVIGSVLGAYLGARLMYRIPEAQLKAGVAVVLLLVGLKELVLP